MEKEKEEKEKKEGVVSVEVEKPNTHAQEVNDRMDDMEDLEGAPGSSKDVRHPSPAKAPTPAERLVDGPATNAETRIATPAKKRVSKRRSPGVHIAGCAYNAPQQTVLHPHKL